MDISKSILAPFTGKFIWRHAVLAALVLGSLFWILSMEPIPQNIGYHSFADTRKFVGVPNFFDVVTNIPFLLVGILGFRVCLRAEPNTVRNAWMVLFVGVGLVSAGSAYYHWSPDNESLMWDRLPMTIGFMGLLVALLGEYVDNRLAAPLLLIPAVGLGLATVLYWHWTDDLRPYYWVQLVPLLTIPAVMVLYRRRYSHQWLLLVALGWYILAKVAESYDLTVFQHTEELISGHSIKHLLAGTGCYIIFVMLKKRKTIEHEA